MFSEVESKIRRARMYSRDAAGLEARGVTINQQELNSLLDELYEEALQELYAIFRDLRG